MAVEHLTKLNDDGTLFGQSATDKIGFYGLTTPIVRPAITAVATATATTTLNETKIDRLYTALRNLGLVATDG
ncbi:MAG: hypothetical protein ACE5NA_11815 [Nitrospiraceae bacterium]